MTYRFARGAWIACFCAGPVFVAALLFATIVESPATPVTIDAGLGEILAGALLGAMPVIVVGAFLAVLPVLLGGKLLAWAGTGNAGLRHPACWAIAGGAVSAAVTILFEFDTVTQFNVALIATGAICALLVRYGTRWPDDSV